MEDRCTDVGWPFTSGYFPRVLHTFSDIPPMIFFFYIVVVVVASFICPRSVLFHWDIGNSRQRLVVLPPIFRSVSAFSQLSALVDVDYEHLSLSFPLSFSLDCPLMRRYGLLLDVDCSHAYFGGGGAPLWHSSDSQRSGDDRDNISGFFLLWLFPPLGPVRLHLPVTSSRASQLICKFNPLIGIDATDVSAPVRPKTLHLLFSNSR